MLNIVSAIIVNDKGEILLLKRSPYRKAFPSKWCTLTAKIEEGETPEECLYREIKEEIGDKAKLKLIKQTKAFEEITLEGEWLVYPFLLEYQGGEIILEEEHTEYKWFARNKIKDLDIVEGILLDLKQLGM